jgi:hypothetical protein
MNYTDNILKEIQDLFTEGFAYEKIIGQNKNDRKSLITDIAIREEIREEDIVGYARRTI